LADSNDGDLRQHDSVEGLQDTYSRGFVYSHAWMKDALLLALNAPDVARRGADLRVQTLRIEANVEDGRWLAELQSLHGRPQTV
jgi:glycerol-3-phosphate dehydrogenase